MATPASARHECLTLGDGLHGAPRHECSATRHECLTLGDGTRERTRPGPPIDLHERP